MFLHKILTTKISRIKCIKFNQNRDERDIPLYFIIKFIKYIKLKLCSSMFVSSKASEWAKPCNLFFGKANYDLLYLLFKLYLLNLWKRRVFLHFLSLQAFLKDEYRHVK